MQWAQFRIAHQNFFAQAEITSRIAPRDDWSCSSLTRIRWSSGNGVMRGCKILFWWWCWRRWVGENWWGIRDFEWCQWFGKAFCCVFIATYDGGKLLFKLFTLYNSDRLRRREGEVVACFISKECELQSNLSGSLFAAEKSYYTWVSYWRSGEQQGGTKNQLTCRLSVRNTYGRYFLSILCPLQMGVG